MRQADTVWRGVTAKKKRAYFLPKLLSFVTIVLGFRFAYEVARRPARK